MPRDQELKFTRTEVTATKGELEKMFRFTFPPKLNCLGVTEGDWRQENGDTWRFHRLAG